MEYNKSLDECKLIASILYDLHQSFQDTFTSRACKLTQKLVVKRVTLEGIGFLTKTLPRLGKALDKALSSQSPFDISHLNFPVRNGTKIPLFLGEFFDRIIDIDGHVLPSACPLCVKAIRDVSFCFYKYELPYTPEQEQEVISGFKSTEDYLTSSSYSLFWVETLRDRNYQGSYFPNFPEVRIDLVAHVATKILARVLCNYDPTDITPRHGPGAVATRQRLWEKFRVTNVSHRITEQFPLDAYFYASLGHVCDRLDTFLKVSTVDHSARVILVPKDSRGPRLISCEPVDFQWIQQGIMNGLVRHIEAHPITKGCVFFTDQRPNQIGALLGSESGKYATLDLKEASDRVSLALVRLLFPSNIVKYLEACRTMATQLPDGSILDLQKFAPMGSALCFPIMALTIWSIVHAVAVTTEWEGKKEFDPTQIHVYGDDVIVPSALAQKAITALEGLGLLVNSEKSCIHGFFRESCGLDAFKGIDVTPVRIRTVWTTSPSPSHYESWIAYANSFFDSGYLNTYELIVRQLTDLYGPLPVDGQIPKGSAPSVRWDCTGLSSSIQTRVNKRLQRLEHRVLCTGTRPLRKVIDGWEMLLRFFTEACSPPIHSDHLGSSPSRESFDAASYTRRDSSVLEYRWR